MLEVVRKALMRVRSYAQGMLCGDGEGDGVLHHQPMYVSFSHYCSRAVAFHGLCPSMSNGAPCPVVRSCPIVPCAPCCVSGLSVVLFLRCVVVW